MIPSKATQSHVCNLAGQHPAMSPTLVVVALVGKEGHTELGWVSAADPIHCKLGPQTATCWKTCVRCPKARGGASQHAVLTAVAATGQPCWQRATAAPGLMEEPLFREGAAWEGAERSNGDVISLEKLSPGAGLLQSLPLRHGHLCLSFLLRKSGSTNIYTVKGPGGGCQCLHC